jgi:hypothetical protein
MNLLTIRDRKHQIRGVQWVAARDKCAAKAICNRSSSKGLETFLMDPLKKPEYSQLLLSLVPKSGESVGNVRSSVNG